MKFVIRNEPAKFMQGPPQPAFIGPAVRLFWKVAGKTADFSFRILDPKTKLGKFLLWAFGPFSVPEQTATTVSLDVGAKILEEFLQEAGTSWVLDWVKAHPNQIYQFLGIRNADGSIELNVNPVWLADP